MSPARKSQRSRILALLVEAKGGWVSPPAILALGVAQYNTRIFELRKLGFRIENKTEGNPQTGARHSWFRLLPRLAARDSQTEKPEAAKSVLKARQNNPEPEWKDRPRVTGLPLFDSGVRP
jgi:Helix-turn-helix domain